MTTQFSLDGIHNRTVQDWRGGDVSPWTNLKRHAREHGVAGAFRADDSLVVFYLDDDKLRRVTFPHAVPV